MGDCGDDGSGANSSLFMGNNDRTRAMGNNDRTRAMVKVTRIITDSLHDTFSVSMAKKNRSGLPFPINMKTLFSNFLNHFLPFHNFPSENLIKNS